MLATSVPDGGTVFHAALECAFNCVQSDRQQGAVLRNRRPVVILITDSEDGDVAATRHWLAQAMAQEQSSGLAADRRVVVHVLGVGNRVNTSYVQVRPGRPCGQQHSVTSSGSAEQAVVFVRVLS